MARPLLMAGLEEQGYEIVVTETCAAALLALQQAEAPQLAILDRMMPEMDGLEFIRRVHSLPTARPPYLILLTSRDQRADISASLDAGANDYLVKPFDSEELRARVEVGRRMVELQAALAEQAHTLRASESRYRLVAENSSDVIWTMNRDGQLSYVSPAIYQLRGYTAAEVMQQPWEEQIAPGSLPLALATFKSLLAPGRRKITGAPVQVELEQRHANGTTVWTEVACKLVQPGRDDSGPVLGVTRNIGARKQAELFLSKERDLLAERVQERTAALQEEINERRRVEAVIREAESKYRLLFEMANDGIFIQTATTIIDCNQKGADLYGFRKEQIVGRSLVTLAPKTQPDGRLSSELVAEITQAALIGVPQVFEWQALGAKGRLLDVEITLSRFELGGELCLQAIVRDIAMRKRNLKLIHDTMSLLDGTLNSTADGILAVDLAGRILKANQKFVDLWRVPQSIIKFGDDHKALAHVLDQVKDPEGFRARVAALYNDPTQESLDLLEFKDGRICERYSQPLRDGDTIVGRVWSFRDVTERALAVDYLDEQRNLLEEKVGERTAALEAEIAARKETETSLRESERRLALALDQAGLAYWEMDAATKTLTFNDRFYALYGTTAEREGGYQMAAEVYAREFLSPEEQPLVAEGVARLLAGNLDEFQQEHRIRRRDGEVRHMFVRLAAVRDATGRVVGMRGTDQDITERKQAELYQEMGREVLQLLNEPGTSQEALARVLAALKTRTGFDAVGIRLQAGDDFPYFVHEGFPQGFLETENTLIARAKDGGTCRNPDGTICLECTCGLVLSGKTDPANPLFTPGGSCWTNDSFPLLKIPVSEDPRLHPRNVCIHHGYASVALIPIRNSERIIGLLQFNDRRKGRFDLPKVELFESIAAHIGSALMRKRAEEATQASEARFRAVTASATDAIISANSAGNIVSWNRGAERIFGYTESEICGQPLSLLIPSRYQDGHRAGMARMQAGGARHVIGKTVEVAGRHQDGHEFPLELSLGEWQVAEGRFFTATIRDITTRKRAEEKLRELSVAVEQNPASIVITDPAGTIEYVNPKFLAVTGYTLEEVLGQNPRVLKSGETSPEAYRELWRTITAGKEWRGEFHNQKKNGELFWESVTISPIRDSADRITHYVAVKEDISARKQAEAERGLMEVQLRQAQKLESIGQLAAGIAHEINTPTQYIGDNTRFLQDAFKDITKVLDHYDRLLQAARQQQVTPELIAATTTAAAAADIAYLTEEVPKSIEQTLQGVARVAKIVRAMKDFSHPGAVEKVPTDLNHAIESTVTVAHNEWKYVADLDLVLAPHLPRVSCLPGEINQVILNLVINAAHAIGDVVGDGSHRKGRIRVSTSQQGEWAEIRVQDSGTGIPESARARIFEPFFTTKAVGKGTGQGLAIAHLVVVKQHGGTIEFETELGQGTTFIVRLPLQSGPATPARNV